MRRRYALVHTYDGRIVRRFWRYESAARAFEAATLPPVNPALFDLRRIR